MEKLIVYPIGKPNLKDEEEMLIGAYWCPIPTEKAYSYVAESGITHMLVNTMIGHEREDKGYYLKPFLLAKKRGVKIVMHCMDKGYNNVKEYAEIFKLQDNFAGVLAKDEPETPDYPFFVEDYKDFKKDFPSLPYYVNLFPIYSSKEQMKAESYEIYLNEYVEKVLKSYRDGDRVLMCDCYPLLVENRLHPRWLKNLEMLRAACDQTGADLYLYLQSQGFCEMWRQPKTVRELTFQMYVNMCYGVKGLLHYPYRTPMNTPSVFPAWVESSANNAYLISTPDLASGTGFVLNVNLNQTFIAEKTYKFTLIYEYVSGASGQWFDVSSDWSGTNVKLTSGSVYPGVTSMRNFNGLTQKRDITETVEELTLRFEINWNTTAAGEFKFGIKVEEVKELELTATDAGTTCTLIENPDDMISGTTTTYLVETTGATWPNITANINKKFEAGKSYKFTVKYAWYSGNSQWNFDYSITWSDGTTVSPTDGLRGGLSGDNYTVSITETTNVQTIILSIKWNAEQAGAFKLGIVVEEV